MYSALRIPERFSNNKLVVSLSIFLFVLPFSEALKHFAFLLLVLVWLNHLTKENDKLRLDILDLIAISIPLLGFVTAALSPFGTIKIAEANLDSVRLFFLWFVVRRMRISIHEMFYLWIAATAGVLFGLVLSAFEFYILKRSVLGELPSVGHINHSAIYLSFVCAWTLIITVENRDPKLRFFALLALTFLIFSLFFSGSRGAIGAFCFFILIYFLSLIKKIGLVPLLKYSLITAVIVGAVSLLSPGVYLKQDIPGTIRDRVPIWRAAVIASEQSLLFGTGAGTYKLAVTPERLKIPGAAAKSFKAHEHGMSFQAHAHNLFINWLCERGILALGLLITFLIACLLWLWRCAPFVEIGSHSDLLHRTQKWCGIAAIIIIVIAGIPNTTLHHEHGALAMILLAFGLKKQ